MSRWTHEAAGVTPLPGHRLHCHHGPIDLVIGADGAPDAVAAAYAAVERSFPAILPALVAELPALREADEGWGVLGPVARRMAAAVAPHRPVFVTPMAAVAGAVADEVLATLCGAGDLDRAYVNNGGDIALHLTGARAFRVGMLDGHTDGSGRGVLRIDASSPVRGVATSGRGGRSATLGIADAVTVLAPDAASADAAATLIANSVNARHPSIARAPACERHADSDLGQRMITVGVGPLDEGTVAKALDAGAAHARRLCARGLIAAAALSLQGRVRVVERGERGGERPNLAGPGNRVIAPAIEARAAMPA